MIMWYTKKIQIYKTRATGAAESDWRLKTQSQRTDGSRAVEPRHVAMSNPAAETKQLPTLLVLFVWYQISEDTFLSSCRFSSCWIITQQLKDHTDVCACFSPFTMICMYFTLLTAIFQSKYDVIEYILYVIHCVFQSNLGFHWFHFWINCYFWKLDTT